MSTAAIEPTSAPPADAAENKRAVTAGDIACRALDIAVAVVMIVLLAPLMAVIAIAIRVESRGPIVFRQRRIGRAQAPFTLHKFRTMRAGVSDEVHREFVVSLIAGDQPPPGAAGAARFKLTSDTRVTSVGRILRRTSLDELPQLWNVVRGEMSLVGPRPPIQYEIDHYPPHWFGRFAVKPGLTGLWQVNGRSTVALEEMVLLDLEYVARRSVWLNVWILVRTVPAVLSLRGAS